MKDWKPGDIAICKITGAIDDIPGKYPPLRLNMEYHVHKVHTCECGSVSLDIGLGSDTGTTCTCEATSSPSSGIWWCLAKRFVKKMTSEDLEKQLEEAVEKEDFLTAATLRDLITQVKNL